MKVSELANELGKTSKEVLDIVKQKDQSASLFAASSLSGDQEAKIRQGGEGFVGISVFHSVMVHAREKNFSCPAVVHLFSYDKLQLCPLHLLLAYRKIYED